MEIIIHFRTNNKIRALKLLHFAFHDFFAIYLQKYNPIVPTEYLSFLIFIYNRDAGASGGATVTREDKVKQVLDEILEKLPEEFNMSEIMGKVEERTPYVIVAFQECERMNYLTSEIKRSLKELDLGLKV